MIIHQQDVEPCFHVAVLVGIVENDHIALWLHRLLHQLLYPMTAVFIHRHVYLRIFLLHLVRLITNLCHWGVFGGQHIAF